MPPVKKNNFKIVKTNIKWKWKAFSLDKKTKNIYAQNKKNLNTVGFSSQLGADF